MLTAELIKKIEDFVYMKPRAIQEIAQYIGKNWRTADRYISEIEKEFGTIATRTFRGGTKGALKIVYWASIEKASHSVFQEVFEKQIFNTGRKEDFSAFDIYQHVDPKLKLARVEYGENENDTDIGELGDLLLNTKETLLIFSGNLSFINLKKDNIFIFSILEALIKKGVIIKIVCRVDITGRENFERLLSLNFKYGKESVEIRHCQQPLRAIIFDNKLFRIKELSEPTGKINELNKKVFIYYTIKDKEWIDWLKRIFWKMFSFSISANKRLEELNRLK